MQIHCTQMRLCAEEQEDGDERPDLDFGLTVRGRIVRGRIVSAHVSIAI